MRIRPDDVIAGFPAKQIRKLLRQSTLSLSVDEATKILGLSEKSALKLLNDLEKQGFIEKNNFAPDPDKSWKNAIKGGALSKALFSAPVSRQAAEQKLSEFMDRVREVNAAGRFLYRVRKVVLFGSFLTESSTVGDLDIAIELVPKEPDSGKHSELILAHANAADLNGKRFGNFIQRLDFAAKEVRAYLKARSRIIQLTDCDDGVLSVAEHRIIYEGPEYNPVVPKYPVPKLRMRRSRKVDDDCPF
jgi:DNA-binding Lrp family transcriptional regulator